jgi:predicted ATPase
MLIDQTPTAPLLILLACRPEFDPPWRARSHVTQLTLPRFTRPQIEEMVLHRTGGKHLPSEVVQQIVEKTDGVPLFVEELTKAIVESGLLKETAEGYEFMDPLPALAIPTTLQDALMARLDRLGPAKGLAQLGATIGRQFAYALLREVAQYDDATVQRELGRLVEAELLYQRGEPPQALYRFKHALIQDAAYQSLLKSTRRQVHQRIAQVLEAQFPETRDLHPELVAHHYTEAGLLVQAILYWQRAGQRASERLANREAVCHFTTGLELLQNLPTTTERTQQELTLYLALGPPLRLLKGPTAPELEDLYTRAYELAQQVGNTQQQCLTLVSLLVVQYDRASLQRTRELAEQVSLSRFLSGMMRL